MSIALILLGIIALLIVWLIMICNGLVRLRTLVEEGWSGIDVQLKRPHQPAGILWMHLKAFAYT